MHITLADMPITSEGRFSPRGPLAIAQPLFLCNLVYRPLKAGDLALNRCDAFVGKVLPCAARRAPTNLHRAVFVGAKLSPQLVLSPAV